MIIIIDYGMGNLHSIFKVLNRLGAKSIISSNVDEIDKAKKLILPGVGHFANGMKKIKDLGLLENLNKKVIQDKTPILGICLGMQLFCKESEEGNIAGLSYLDAETIRFRVSDQKKFKIPHIGWNTIEIKKNNSLFKNLDKDDMFYFLHSYHLVCKSPDDVLSTTNYDYEFVSAIQKDNIWGTQFHPEKSHKQGMQVLKNFIAVT